MGDRWGDSLTEAYVTARQEIIERGFGCEIDWQAQRNFEEVTESSFLEEAGWVVLSSGMKESVVRAKFPQLTRAFCDWSSARAIVQAEASCRRRAMATFAHAGKIEAILAIARRVHRVGIEEIKRSVGSEGVNYLGSFEFIGPVTRYHLAKNLGLDVVKPDRHLSRVAAALGYPSATDLCSAIAEETGDRVAVVDLVIWRFATLRPDYVDHWRCWR